MSRTVPFVRKPTHQKKKDPIVPSPISREFSPLFKPPPLHSPLQFPSSRNSGDVQALDSSFSNLTTEEDVISKQFEELYASTLSSSPTKFQTETSLQQLSLTLASALESKLSFSPLAIPSEKPQQNSRENAQEESSDEDSQPNSGEEEAHQQISEEEEAQQNAHEEVQQQRENEEEEETQEELGGEAHEQQIDEPTQNADTLSSPSSSSTSTNSPPLSPHSPIPSYAQAAQKSGAEEEEEHPKELSPQREQLQQQEHETSGPLEKETESGGFPDEAPQEMQSTSAPLQTQEKEEMAVSPTKEDQPASSESLSQLHQSPLLVMPFSDRSAEPTLLTMPQPAPVQEPPEEQDIYFGVITVDNDDQEDHQLHLNFQPQNDLEEKTPSPRKSGANHFVEAPSTPPSPPAQLPSSSGQVTRLSNWHLRFTPSADLFPLNIGVIGWLEEKQMIYRSSTIQTRVTNREVRTLRGSTFYLEGPINESQCRARGFPDEVIEAFRYGFPPHWKNVMREYITQDFRDFKSPNPIKGPIVKHAPVQKRKAYRSASDQEELVESPKKKRKLQTEHKSHRPSKYDSEELSHHEDEIGAEEVYRSPPVKKRKQAHRGRPRKSRPISPEPEVQENQEEEEQEEEDEEEEDELFSPLRREDTNLSRTRSGRRVLRPLEFWRGEAIARDFFGNPVEVRAGTSEPPSRRGRKRKKNEAESPESETPLRKARKPRDSQNEPENGENGANDDWTTEELSKLKEAQRVVNPTTPSYWNDVAKMVGTRTAKECQTKYFQTPDRQKKRVVRNEDEPAEESPLQSLKNGKLFGNRQKDRRKIRALVRQGEKDYLDDPFESTPFKKQLAEIPEPLSENDQPMEEYDQEAQIPPSNEASITPRISMKERNKTDGYINKIKGKVKKNAREKQGSSTSPNQQKEQPQNRERPQTNIRSLVHENSDGEEDHDEYFSSGD